MMRRVVITLAVAAVVATPALAQKVYVDFDHDVDFGAFRTFAIDQNLERTLANEAPLVHERVLASIRKKLIDGGLEEDAANPDLVVKYQLNVREEMQLETVNMGYSYGPGWGYDPYWAWSGYGTIGTSSTRQYTYHVGTLILDIREADGNKLIWRASAEDTLTGNPEKGAKKLDRALHKIGKIFRKEYRKVEKARARSKS